MFDHVGLKVSNLATSTEFYRKTLAPLGFELCSSGDGYAGFRPPGAPALWLALAQAHAWADAERRAHPRPPAATRRGHPRRLTPGAVCPNCRTQDGRIHR